MNLHVHIGHPSDVHFFKHAVAAWRERGHAVHVTTRDIPVARRLLEARGLPYAVVGRKCTGAAGLGLELARHTAYLAPRLRRWRADASLSFGGTFTVYAARLAGCRGVVFNDTEIARLQNRITYPFAHVIVTPRVYPDDLGRKHVRFNGFKELAYLHPAVFAPSAEVPARYGLSADRPYSVVRFISWEASHDFGVRGTSQEEKQRLVDRLRGAGDVLVVPEGPAPAAFAALCRPCDPDDFHTLLYYARAVVSEGASTASEACVLGTPALYVNPIGRSYLDAMAATGLVRRARPGDDLEAALADVLAAAADPAACRAKAAAFVAGYEDVTEFIVRFIENRDYISI
ncbi:MAG: DUF354 domain-containing protein [Lentisphaerae bacterium]|nr:DUF354 domain-containing protein [Lentisphaerota bacterium]